jgi:molecular chaperone GrpE
MLKQTETIGPDDETQAVEDPLSNGSPAETDSETTPDEAGAAAGASELETALGERDRALAERDELRDKLLRAQAEFENVRKRLLREHDEFRQYASMETIESLLPIVDDFERAIAAPGVDPEVRKGLELIHNRIVDVFTRSGLEPVDSAGHFDPNIHQAVDRASTEHDDEDQKILEVYQKGYLYKEKLLRPAMVKVAVKD